MQPYAAPPRQFPSHLSFSRYVQQYLPFSVVITSAQYTHTQFSILVQHIYWVSSQADPSIVVDIIKKAPWLCSSRMLLCQLGHLINIEAVKLWIKLRC